MFDTSRLTPEAQPIVEAAAAIYLRHTQPWFVGLVVHGSAFKGGFIPGCSDIDFQLYLDNRDFPVPLEIYLSIQKEISQIDPAPFRYIQCYPHSNMLPEGHIGPIPGAYLLLAGRLPIAEATRSQLQESARKRIAALDPMPKYIVDGLLESGIGRLPWNIRWLCTDVWPTVYQVLALQGHDPFTAWSLPKPQAIALMPSDTPLGQTIRAFYQAVQTYYPSEESVAEGLAVIETGIAFLQNVKTWWLEHEDDIKKSY
jgi:hypothetical protein